MSIEAVVAAFELRDLTLAERMVLVCIADEADEKCVYWRDNFVHISKKCDVTLSEIMANVKSLQKKAALIKVDNADRGEGPQTAFVIRNKNGAWRYEF